MALVVHSSSPALVTGDKPRTTASFTAPADSLLVALVSSNAGTTTHTMSSTGGTLTWTSRVKRDILDSGGNVPAVEIFTAPAASSAARTVTATSVFGTFVTLKVLVITGVELSVPVGATGEGSSSTASLTPNVYTSTGKNSLAVGIAADENQAGAVTSSDVGYAWNVSGETSGIAVHKAATTPTPGSTVTLNFNGSGSRLWNWAAIEVLAAPDLPRAAVFRPTGAVHRAASW
ncbi:hypothetical protein [Nonomuraea wenchangensis]|uniref:Uncharacterized protein n=1 Tax=Nonomuraea wenchangensis TaxID=568860 RepID=A0A1I0ET27_9ACTN|nr:hypothetical protein [Nonomuraea wenchangensis]SET47993.1 hypothetical protein SAMN05421811_103171 [Nonomuraea wenchangensis]